MTDLDAIRARDATDANITSRALRTALAEYDR